MSSLSNTSPDNNTSIKKFPPSKRCCPDFYQTLGLTRSVYYEVHTTQSCKVVRGCLLPTPFSPSVQPKNQICLLLFNKVFSPLLAMFIDLFIVMFSSRVTIVNKNIPPAPSNLLQFRLQIMRGLWKFCHPSLSLKNNEHVAP